MASDQAPARHNRDGGHPRSQAPASPAPATTVTGATATSTAASSTNPSTRPARRSANIASLNRMYAQNRLLIAAHPVAGPAHSPGAATAAAATRRPAHSPPAQPG